MNKCLGNIEILYQTVWGVQWGGPRQNSTRKEPQLNTSPGKAVRKKLCKEQLIKLPPPTPNPQTATKSHCLHLAQPAPAQLCNRFGCTSSRLSLPTAASSGESKWITAPVGQLSGAAPMSGDVGSLVSRGFQRPDVLPLVEAVFDANMIFW